MLLLILCVAMFVGGAYAYSRTESTAAYLLGVASVALLTYLVIVSN